MRSWKSVGLDVLQVDMLTRTLSFPLSFCHPSCMISACLAVFYRKELLALSILLVLFQSVCDSLQRYCPISLLAARLACRSGGRERGGVAALSRKQELAEFAESEG